MILEGLRTFYVLSSKPPAKRKVLIFILILTNIIFSYKSEPNNVSTSILSFYTSPIKLVD